MSLVELFILAVGLSMDAFAVAVCKGLSMKRLNKKHAVIIGLYLDVYKRQSPLRTRKRMRTANISAENATAEAAAEVSISVIT